MIKINQRRVPAIKVEQWLKAWDHVKFESAKNRSKPEAHFFIFSLPAAELRSLCGIFRRQTKTLGPRSSDLGIQRQHDPERSDEIQRFVKHGYPWSTLSPAKQKNERYYDLRKPGWLPTSIVINILRKGERREGNPIANKDVVTVEIKGSAADLLLPYPEWTAAWEAEGTPPFEVIDGQHRLWAFDPNDARLQRVSNSL
jgi:hypothetical protein